MEFNFSIRDNIKASWNTFKTHPWFFVGLALVMLIINSFSRFHKNFILQIIIIIAAIIWSYVWLSVVLSAVDKKEDLLTYENLKLHLPNFNQFFMLVLVGIVTGLIVVAGFIMLIIPGVYFMMRLVFSNFSYVDRQEGVKAALRYSWNLVKGDIFWTVFLTITVAIALIFLGILAAVVGVLVTYPLAMLLIAHLYRSLTQYHAAKQQIAPQPTEIAPTPETPVEPAPEPEQPIQPEPAA